MLEGKKLTNIYILFTIGSNKLVNQPVGYRFRRLVVTRESLKSLKQGLARLSTLIHADTVGTSLLYRYSFVVDEVYGRPTKGSAKFNPHIHKEQEPLS